MVLASSLQSLGWPEWGPQAGNKGTGPPLQLLGKAARAATLGAVQSMGHLGLSSCWYLMLCKKKKKTLLVPVLLVN